MHDLTFGHMSRCQTSLAVKSPAVKCHLRSSFSNLGCRSKIRGQMSLRSNVLGSNVPRSNVTCRQVFLILVADQKSRGQMSLRSNVPRSNVTGGQMSRGQMSLAVKCPAVKCHLRSNVPRSNVSCGQTSHRPSVVKCPLWSDVITPLRGQMSLAVYCPAVKRPRSNVPWSNETVVIGDPIIKRHNFFHFCYIECNRIMMSVHWLK